MNNLQHDFQEIRDKPRNETVSPFGYLATREENATMASSTALDSNGERVMRFWGRLKRRAMGTCRNHHDAEDAASETVLKHLEANGKDAAGRPIGEGLSVVRAAGWAIDEIRKRDREAARLRPYGEHVERLRKSPLLSGITDPAKVVEVAELLVRVHQILNDLDPPTRIAVLKLFFQKGLSYAEISEALHMVPGTVRCQVSRGVIQLRDRLTAEGVLDLLREALP